MGSNDLQLPSSMKQAVMTEPGSIELRDVALPVMGEGDVLVKIDAVGICTWEQKFFKGIPGSYPFIGGHEISGRVLAVGPAVAQPLSPGDKVVVASLTRCGECYYCRRGMDNLCLHTGSESTPGEMWGPGGFAEYLLQGDMRCSRFPIKCLRLSEPLPNPSPVYCEVSTGEASSSVIPSWSWAAGSWDSFI